MLLRYPSAFCYLFYHPQVGTWLAATPETLLYHHQGEFRTMALAGTKVGDKEWQPKELEEQQIVTDTIVSQLQPYTTTLKVTDPHTVCAGSVQHLCTEISGTLPTDKVNEVIQRLHPTPAVCGYPTDKARTFIIEHEPYDREYYTGYCGLIEGTKMAALYVNLRCMQIDSQHTYLYVGGGITKDSIPQKEYEETQNKAQTMKLVVSA